MVKVKKLFNRENIPSSKKLVVFSIFLFISSTLWFFNAMSNVYSDDITIEFVYVNYPEGKGILGELPSKTKIDVSMNGLSLFRHKYLKNIQIIPINIQQCSQQKDNKLIFDEKLIKKSINKVLGNEIKILNTTLARKIYSLSQLATKEVVVLSNINIEYAKQYRASSKIIISPNKIKVSGHKTLIDTLKAVYANSIELLNLKENITKNIKLIKNSNLRYNVDSVKVSLLVERFTEKQLVIPIKIINKPKNINVNLFQKEVKITFNVSLNEFDNINSSLFNAVIDYNKIKKSKSNIIDVRVIKYPKHIEDFSISPKTVEFLLEKIK